MQAVHEGYIYEFTLRTSLMSEHSTSMYRKQLVVRAHYMPEASVPLRPVHFIHVRNIDEQVRLSPL